MPSNTQVQDEKTNKAKIIAALVAFIAFLSALGIGFQNATAIIQLLIQSTTLAIGNVWAIGIAAGGICSTIVNYCLNVELLEDFWERISGKKPAPHLPSVGKKLQYGIGIAVFIITGCLFGLAAVSIGATGGIAILAIIAGVFVSLVMIPQELETWLQSFDDPVAVTIGKKIHEVKACDDTSDIENVYQLIDKASGFPAELKKVTLKAGLQKIKTELMLKNDWIPTENGLASLTQAIGKVEEGNHNFDEILNDLIKESNDITRIELNTLKEKISIQQQKLLKDPSTETKVNIVNALNTLKETAEKDQPQISLFDAIKKWWLQLTFGRFIGLVISLGNVMALSLLFTIGITPLLVGIGVAAFPALITGFCIAFTIGAFTEFYFYHYFLADFCDQIKQRWTALFNSENYGVGIVTVLVNATVNGILGYTSVFLLAGLLAAAGLAVPPLLPLAIVAGAFAGIASCLLGTDFWIRNAKRFANFIGSIVNTNPSNASDNPAYVQLANSASSVNNDAFNEDNFNSQNPLEYQPTSTGNPNRVTDAKLSLGVNL